MKLVLFLLLLTSCVGNIKEKNIKNKNVQKNSNKNYCDIIVQIEKNNITYNLSDYKRINLIIINESNKPINIPKNIRPGSFNDQDVSFQFQEKQNGKWKKRIPSVDEEKDYQYPPSINREFNQMNSKDTILIRELDIEVASKISERGHYRIRAILRLKDTRDCEIKESEWVEFTVI